MKAVLGRGLLRCGLIAALAIATNAAAGPRKVLVLPVDGNADSVTRSLLTGSLQKLSRGIEGQVAIGDTSFTDAATAVGCDPSEASCADSVLSTLAVDELVWGTATTSNGKTTVVVKRVAKGTPPKQQTTTITAGSTDATAKVETELGPLFDIAPVLPAVTTPHDADGDSALSRRDTTDRNLGVGLAVGSTIALLGGFALWESASSVQDRINMHASMTLADIHDLKSLEDQAGNYAFWGNAMVIVGLGAGAASAYFLWKDHKASHPTMITPVPADAGTGLTLVVRGRW